ncbi:NAD dependent epimerase/dehydratase [Lentinus tigrinus ALCF2SS1-6]|uniref:NAD dependent epimerase/dehydratase n=1 Tax=Lentinus tigrinus ALCF2SS1-6 TaxID=1328759 RepID=A0A5C2SDW2_9APHY|nr:NAD dependent epimerase/dehydratase [Lentinus tigrinus ALCF2SS1-6]
MPAVKSGKILVTGVNGFIAGWVAKELLEQGFSVRGTVRSTEKGEHIRKALAAYGDRLEFAVVQDITLPGAFDEAVKGVDAIAHLASPVSISAKDPDQLIRPALDGTTSILHSASAPGSSVKRIVHISSLAAVVDPRHQKPVIHTEADWNESDPAEVREKGKGATPIVMYRTSKVLAEKAAWELYREGREKSSIGWDLVTLCPPWTFGPTLGATTPADFTTAVATWFSICIKEEENPLLWSPGGSWTDVRDFAAATVITLTKPEAGGERFIICRGPFYWKQWVSIVRRLLGKPESEGDQTYPDHEVTFDSQKSQDVLGVQYRDMEETAAFMIADFKANGWC